MTLTDGSTYCQTCYYSANMVKTIISPTAVLASSKVFTHWTQDGFKDDSLPDILHFSCADGLTTMSFQLRCHDGLYYCNMNVFMIDRNPVHPRFHRMLAMVHHSTSCPPPKYTPPTKARQVKLEVWAFHFGCLGEHQLDLVPKHVKGTPPMLNIIHFDISTLKNRPT